MQEDINKTLSRIRVFLEKEDNIEISLTDQEISSASGIARKKRVPKGKEISLVGKKRRRLVKTKDRRLEVELSKDSDSSESEREVEV